MKISKFAENHLITKKHTMFTLFAKPRVWLSDLFDLFTLTQLLFLANRDIVYCWIFWTDRTRRRSKAGWV